MQIPTFFFFYEFFSRGSSMKQQFAHVYDYLRQELSVMFVCVSLLLGVLFAIVVALVPNYQLLWYALLSSKISFVSVFFGLIHGIFTSMPLYGAVMLLLIGFLSGVNVVLIARRSMRLRQAGAVGVGSMFGALLGGCSACATGILPLLGMAGALSVLPFHGSELAVVAVIILLATIYWNAHAEVCRVPLKK